MDITHGSQMSYEDVGAKHRTSGIAFKTLSLGTDDTPENYMFMLARQRGFFSPVHKHNFDQFRYAVKGDFSLSPDVTLKQGQLAYHPEGAEYGPQNDGPQEQELLVLQFGGASGQGYVSLKQIKGANEELARTGKFEMGKYYPSDGTGPVDGYEAAWTKVMGRKKLVYPETSYDGPVVMDLKSHEYRADEALSDNAKIKRLGTFSERKAVAQTYLVEGEGELAVGGDNAIHLIYVLNGELQVGGTCAYPESCIRLQAGTSCTLSTNYGFEVLEFVLPMLR